MTFFLNFLLHRSAEQTKEQQPGVSVSMHICSLQKFKHVKDNGNFRETENFGIPKGLSKLRACQQGSVLSEEKVGRNQRKREREEKIQGRLNQSIIIIITIVNIY